LDAGLYLKPEKCEFHKETVRYLRLILLTMAISMDKDTVETELNQSQEKKTKNKLENYLFEVNQFLGLCNDYDRFITKFLEK
jgi:hypothetical protein